jgi:hypothetical protein
MDCLISCYGPIIICCDIYAGYLQFFVHVMLFLMLNVLYFYIGTFRSMHAVPNMAILCSSLILCFRDILQRYFVNYFEMVPVALLLLA